MTYFLADQGGTGFWQLNAGQALIGLSLLGHLVSGWYNKDRHIASTQQNIESINKWIDAHEEEVRFKTQQMDQLREIVAGMVEIQRGVERRLQMLENRPFSRPNGGT